MNNWEIKDNCLVRKFKFPEYEDCIQFVNQIAAIAERQNHHPKIILEYNSVEVFLTTHDNNNVVTNKDYKLAEGINQIL